MAGRVTLDMVYYGSACALNMVSYGSECGPRHGLLWQGVAPETWSPMAVRGSINIACRPRHGLLWQGVAPETRSPMAVRGALDNAYMSLLTRFQLV